MAKTRKELPYLPYPRQDVTQVINQHRFGASVVDPSLLLHLVGASGFVDQSSESQTVAATGSIASSASGFLFDDGDDGIQSDVGAVVGSGTLCCRATFASLPSGTHVVLGAAIAGTYVLINQLGDRLLGYWQSGGPFFASNTGTLTAGVEYHIAMVRDGSIGRLYLDGVELGTGSATTDWASGRVSVGRWPGRNDRTVDAVINDIRVYDRALSSAEVLALA